MKMTSLQYDLHNHSAFSADSQAPMEGMIERALALGLKGICFTEHLDTDSLVRGEDFDLDIPAYHAGLSALRERYAGRIEVLFGIELGMQPHLGRHFRALTRDWPFDFVLASQHLVYRRDPYYESFWRLHPDKRRILTDYFDAMLRGIRAFPDFDSLAHLDYIVRYDRSAPGVYNWFDYADTIDQILMFLIEHGKCLEVNTKPLLTGLPEPNPCTDVLMRYYELGGRAITLGSDSHDPSTIGGCFDAAAALLREIGFTHYTVFRAREPVAIPLP